MSDRKLIRKFRVECNMTQEQFAKWQSVGESTVRRWETGRIEPPASLRMLLGVMLRLGMCPDQVH
jgi:DNA-binding transcriptional regulator YiaG